MANNSPTNLAKGGEKQKPKTIEEMAAADAKRKEGKQEDDVTKRELTAEDTEPVREGGAAEAAADLALEQARGRVFGDITSSNGDSNTRGLHGRDGGIVPDGPSNPAPSEEAQEHGDSSSGAPEGDVSDIVEDAKEDDAE